MKLLALDTETTTFNKGHPYDKRNKLVCFSFALQNTRGAVQWDDQAKVDCTEMVLEADRVIGFNFKFDYAWFKKEGIDFGDVEIWDVQLAEFILSNQTNKFPSLNETCIKYGLEVKEDVVKTEYWDKGLDTTDVPWEILSTYATKDADLTLQCYYKQLPLMTPAQIQLCRLQCADLKVLQEMEETGLLFNEELCQTRAKEIDDKISEIESKLASVYPHIPINFGSNDQLSSFLYGGTVDEDTKVFDGYFKSGQKVGQPKYKNETITHQLPRIYTPLRGSEMAKEGKFATDEGTLRKLRGNRKVLDMILELSKLQKLNGTYYRGLVKTREEMNWEVGTLHGNLNQTTAATGRLSSSKPNMQNFATELQDIFISRYND